MTITAETETAKGNTRTDRRPDIPDTAAGTMRARDTKRTPDDTGAATGTARTKQILPGSRLVTEELSVLFGIFNIFLMFVKDAFK